MTSRKTFWEAPLQFLFKTVSYYFSATYKKRRKASEERPYEPLYDQGRRTSAQCPDQCPRCGHSPVATILWGLPDFKSQELQRSMGEGKFTWGGCITGFDDPAWQCSKCGQRIWRAGTHRSYDLMKIYEQRKRERKQL